MLRGAPWTEDIALSTNKDAALIDINKTTLSMRRHSRRIIDLATTT